MNDDKVVPLHPKREGPCRPLHIFECQQCQSTHWRLFCDGSIECGICKRPAHIQHFDPREPPPKAG